METVPIVGRPAAEFSEGSECKYLLNSVRDQSVNISYDKRQTVRTSGHLYSTVD